MHMELKVLVLIVLNSLLVAQVTTGLRYFSAWTGHIINDYILSITKISCLLANFKTALNKIVQRRQI